MVLAMVSTLLPTAAFADEAYTCGKEAYAHTGACYEETLVCTEEVSEGHQHSDVCYTEGEAVLTCGDEDPEHIHGDGCYTPGEPVLTCGREASEGHAHTDTCYESLLVCTQEEHEHGEECLAVDDVMNSVGGFSAEKSNIVYTDGQLNPTDAFEVNEYHFPNAVVEAMKQMAVNAPDFETEGRSFTELVLDFDSGPGLNAGPIIGMWRATVGLNGRGNPETLKSVTLKYYDWWKVKTYSYTIPVSELSIHCYDKGGANLRFAQIGIAADEPEGDYYTVTFDWGYDADGTGDNKRTYETVESNANVAAPGQMDRKGYTFDGWFTAAEDGEKVDFPVTVTDDVVYYAHWTKDQETPTQKTDVQVWYYYGESVKVQGDAVEAQDRTSQMITDSWVAGLKTMDFYKGSDTETFEYGGFEIQSVKDGGGWGDPIYELNGPLDLTGLASVRIHLTYNKVTAPITYHSNFDPDATYRKFVDKTGDNAYAYTVLDYPATGLNARTGYTFQGWSETPGGEATISAGSSQTATEAGQALYAVWTKDQVTPPEPGAEKTSVQVWHYYSEDPVAGNNVEPLERTSDVITTAWVNGLNTMDLYAGGDKDCFAYSGFELFTKNDGENEWSDAVYAVDGSLVLTDVASVKIHLNYEKVSAPVTYHSNFGSDATHRVLAAKNGDGAYAYTALSYAATGLTTRSGYTFQGWSATRGGSATVSSGSAQTTAVNGLDLFAVWTQDSTGRDDNPGGGNDGNERPGRPSVTPPVEDEEVILPDDVPLGDGSNIDQTETTVPVPENGEDFVITDEEVPLGNLPQTGTAQAVDPTWTLGLLALAASMSVAGLAVVTLRRREENEN